MKPLPTKTVIEKTAEQINQEIDGVKQVKRSDFNTGAGFQHALRTRLAKVIHLRRKLDELKTEQKDQR